MNWQLADVEDHTNGEQIMSSRIAMPWSGYSAASFRGPDGLEVILYLKFDALRVPDLVGVHIERADGWGVVGQTDLRAIPLGELQGLFMDDLNKRYPPRTPGWSEYSETGRVPESVRNEWPHGDKRKVAVFVQAIYNSAVARRLPATAAVAEAFEVSRATAGRMVDYARKNEFPLVDPVPYSVKPPKEKDTKHGTATPQSRADRDGIK